MYILVLFNEKKYQVTSLTEKGRSVSSVAKHDFFLKKQRKTLVCDLLRRALSKK